MKIVIRREGQPTYVCHGSVKNGKYLYHNDSTHDLAGKSVKLEVLECPQPTRPY